MLPLTMPASSEIIFSGKKRILDLTKDGVIYALNEVDLVTIQKSTDWGQTWVDVWSAPSSVGQARKLTSGQLIVTRNSSIYLSDENEENFALKVDLDDIGTSDGDGAVYKDFGFSCYENIIIAGEYGSGVGDVFASTDFGENWSVIFTSPDNRYSHIHDVAYDPYEGLIWIVTGDGTPLEKIFVSNNLGASWITLKEDESVRSTAIMPLPDCVLFGSDEGAEFNVWRQDRRPISTHNKTLEPNKVFVPVSHYPEDGGDAWMGRTAIKYGREGYTVFGWHQPGNNTVAPSNVYATKDGINYRMVWSDHKLPVSNEDGEPHWGVEGVFGPTSDDIFLIQYNNDDGVNDHHMVKVSLDL